MKKLSLALLAFCVCSGVSALDIKSDAVIVSDNEQGGPEKMAAPLLKEHLEKVFGGKKIPVVKTLPEKGTVIELKRDSKLAGEEWKIEAQGNKVVISGGFPRGIYYGVCEFLERFAGVRWFTAWETKIPRAEKLTVPDGTIQGKPAFPLQRNLGDSVGGKIPHPRHVQFKARQRHTYFGNMTPDQRYPSFFHQYTLGGSHTFFKLTNALPKEMEHCLPVNSSGMRVRATSNEGPGQICFSNREFREFAKKEVAKWIKAEEAKLNKRETGHKLHVIDFSQNDNPDFCQCEGCRKLYQKYDSCSGAMLEFINDVASAFPNRVFQIFAYGPTITPPKNIKAADNVMVHFAFLSYGGKHCDLLRPLSAPGNACLREVYAKWKPLAKRKAIWCYHRLYSMSEMFPWPQCCYWYIPEDTRFYYDFGMEKYYLETECIDVNGLVSPRAFHDLHVYLASAMVINPLRKDAGKLIEEFFDFQYGPAAPEMKAYAAYLKKRLDAIPGRVADLPLPARNCFDVEFFKTINGLLAKAEAKAKNDPALMKRIAIEHIPVDCAALYLWEKYGKKACGDRKAVCDRYENALKLFFERYFPTNNKLCQTRKEKMASLIAMLRNPPPVPAGMENLDIVQIPLADAHNAVSDPEALNGKAIHCRPVKEAQWAHEKHLLQFGVYDFTDKRAVLHKFFLPGELKQDEKYHLYSIGKFVPNVMNYNRLWGHVSWAIDLSRVLRPAINPLDPGRELEIFLSMKVTGPAYVRNSKKPNDIWIDQVICVKHGIVEQEYGKKMQTAKMLELKGGNAVFAPQTVLDFKPVRGIAPMGKAIMILRGGEAVSNKIFDYQPEKKYRISCKARMMCGKPGILRIGFAPLTQDGKRIESEQISCKPKSLTELAAPAKAGDKVLKLKDASLWDNKYRWARIAFNAKADLSDLPNRELANTKAGTIADKKTHWEISLAKPLKKDYPAGTAVRQHTADDSYIYCSMRTLNANQQLLSGTLSGIRPFGVSASSAWAGTKKFRVIVVFGSADARAVAEFEDLRVEEIK